MVSTPFLDQVAAAVDHAGRNGLYSNSEHDACGVGFVANIKGRASHALVQQALLILQNLNHRGAVGADPLCGDGADVMVPDALERKLYVIRKTASHKIQALKLKHGKEYFVPSMSTRTIVYKGLLLADQVGRYYRDLRDPRVVSAIALVHQRFSTNTFPSWELAHPYRLVAHNGEINTVKGN